MYLVEYKMEIMVETFDWANLLMYAYDLLAYTCSIGDTSL